LGLLRGEGGNRFKGPKGAPAKKGWWKQKKDATKRGRGQPTEAGVRENIMANTQENKRGR